MKEIHLQIFTSFSFGPPPIPTTFFPSILLWQTVNISMLIKHPMDAKTIFGLSLDSRAILSSVVTFSYIRSHKHYSTIIYNLQQFVVWNRQDRKAWLANRPEICVYGGL